MISDKLVIKLIQKHYEKDEKVFDATSKHIANTYLNNGKEELGNFILAQMDLIPTFVPQDVEIKGKEIKDPSDDFGDIMIMALRYALGRRTYVTDEVPEFIKVNAQYITERICVAMLRDIAWYVESRKNKLIKDDDCDYNSWIDLQTWLFTLGKTRRYNLVSYMTR